MLRPSLFWFTAVSWMFVAVLGIAADRKPGEERKPAAAEGREREARRGPFVQGRITAYEAGMSLTIESGGGRGGDPPAKTVVLKLDDKTKVEFVGILKDVLKTPKVGDYTIASLDAEGSDKAVFVQVQRAPNLNAKIAAVAGDGKSFTIEGQPKARGEAPEKIEVKITDKTKVGYGRGLPEQLVVGNFASVWLDESAKDTAIGLIVNRPPANLYGKVSAVSADGKTVTLEIRARDGNPQTEEFKLSDKSKVEFIGGEPKDKKLKLGHNVQVWLEEGSKDAAIVQANTQRAAPEIRGTIAAVSGDGKTVTVSIQERGAEPTKFDVKVNDKTEIEFTGIEKDEEKKLTVGAPVMVWLTSGSKETAAVLLTGKPAERRER